MNGKANDGTRWATIIVVELGPGLLQQFGDVASWNEFVSSLVHRGLTPVAWGKGERPSPVGVMFDLRRLGRRHYDLAGIDLTLCDLAGADFECANLRGAKVGPCPAASFRRARLRGAQFRGDIGGCIFDDAELDGADFSHASHAAGDPPKGLPPEALSACKALTAVDDAERMADVPPERPLRATVTIHEVPW